MASSSYSNSSKKRSDDDEIHNLLLKLQALLPQLNSTVSASEVLKETCNYIKKLQKEVNDLSERLLKQMDSMGDDFEIVKAILFSNKI